MAVVAWEKSGMKKESCWPSPRNDLTPVRFVGWGKSVMARILSVSGFNRLPQPGSQRIVSVFQLRTFSWTV